MRPLRRLIPLFFLLLAPLASAQTVAAPELSADSAVAASGFFRLTWEAPDGLVSELQEAGSADFGDASRAYTGTDRARFVSGKADGQYWYRVRTFNDNHPSAWSEPVVVEVRHHSLGRAVGFFSLGAFVFVATIGLVAGRARRRS